MDIRHALEVHLSLESFDYLYKLTIRTWHIALSGEAIASTAQCLLLLRILSGKINLLAEDLGRATFQIKITSA